MPFQKNGVRQYKRELAWEKKNKPNRVKDRAQRNAARATVAKAKGVKGYLLKTFTGDGQSTFVFRVYDKSDDGKLNDFTDYDILHYDLEVEILDDAVFYNRGTQHWIDYDDSYLNQVVDEILEEDKLNGNS